jgi:hypothetical protein
MGGARLRAILLLAAAALSGCTVWQKTEVNAEVGQAYDAWDNPLFAIDATVPVTDRVAVKVGHISDPTTRGPRDPNLTWAGVRMKLK